jgi:signal peptidase II
MSRRLMAYSIAAVLFALDRVTKLAIQANMAPQDAYAVIPGFFNIVRTGNRGIVFGLMSEGDAEWRAFFLVGLTVLVLAFVATVLWQSSGRGMAASGAARVGLSLVLGGAVGNLYDRLFSGAVTDFLDFHISAHHWPAFNLADSAISVGAVLVLLDLWLSRRKAVAT